MNSNKFKEEGSIVYFNDICMIYCLSFPLTIKCVNTLINTDNIYCYIQHSDLKPQTEKRSFFFPTANK